MNVLLVVVRLVHIVFGALWVGMMAFTVVFLTPALRDVGPDGGKVLAALQRRRVMIVMPIIGLVTIVSGLGLVQWVYGGMSRLMTTSTGLAFAAGGAGSVIAFLLGVTVMRSAMLRANALTQALGSAGTDAERAQRGAEIQRLRARGTRTGRLVAALLLFAAGAMAVARYL